MSLTVLQGLISRLGIHFNILFRKKTLDSNPLAAVWCSCFCCVPGYTRRSLLLFAKCLSSKQWGGWKPNVNGEGTAHSEVGKEAMPAGFLVHHPQLCGLVAWLASIHGTRSLSRPLSICPGCSHTWVLRQTLGLAVPRPHFAAKSRKWPSKLDVPRAMIKAAPSERPNI